MGNTSIYYANELTFYNLVSNHIVNNWWKFGEDPLIIDWDMESDFFRPAPAHKRLYKIHLTWYLKVSLEGYCLISSGNLFQWHTPWYRNDVSPELLTLEITHDNSLALVLYLCWFISMPDIKYVGALPLITLNMWPSINCSTLYSIGSSPTCLNSLAPTRNLRRAFNINRMILFWVQGNHSLLLN